MAIGIEERDEPFALIVLEAVPGEGQGCDSRRREPGEEAPAQAGDEQQPHPGHRDDEGRPEIRLVTDEDNGKGDEGDRADDHGKPQRPLPLCKEGSHHQRSGELCDLGRLELETARGKPPLRSLRRGADQEHRDERGQGGGVEPGRPPGIVAGLDVGEGDHHPAADEKAHELAMEQRLPARRVRSEQADPGEQQEGADERHVEAREAGTKPAKLHPLTARGPQ